MKCGGGQGLFVDGALLFVACKRFTICCLLNASTTACFLVVLPETWFNCLACYCRTTTMMMMMMAMVIINIVVSNLINHGQEGLVRVFNTFIRSDLYITQYSTQTTYDQLVLYKLCGQLMTTVLVRPHAAVAVVGKRAFVLFAMHNNVVVAVHLHYYTARVAIASYCRHCTVGCMLDEETKRAGIEGKSSGKCMHNYSSIKTEAKWKCCWTWHTIFQFSTGASWTCNRIPHIRMPSSHSLFIVVGKSVHWKFTPKT